MPRRCVIPGCDFRNRNDGILHTFEISKRDAVRLSWQNAINLTAPTAVVLRPKQLICEKHFAEGDIILQRELLGPDGSVLEKSQYTRVRIRKGALPSLFPWTQPKSPQPPTAVRFFPICPTGTVQITTESKQQIPQNSQPDATHFLSPTTASENYTKIDGSSGPIKSEVVDIIECKPDIADEIFASEEPQSPEPLTFSGLINSTLKLPPSWSRTTISSGDFRAILFCNVTAAEVDGDLKTGIFKEVLVQNSMELRCRFVGSDVNLYELVDVDDVYSKEVLENVLALVDEMNVCGGCRTLEDSSVDSTYTDNLGRKRHRRCPLVSDLEQCQFCRTAGGSGRKNQVRDSRRQRVNLKAHHPLLVQRLGHNFAKGAQVKAKSCN